MVSFSSQEINLWCILLSPTPRAIPGVRKTDHQLLSRSTRTHGLSIEENKTVLCTLGSGGTFSAFAKLFSLLWSIASSLTLCKHGFVRLKMYFKNVTNYPMACNHSFRTVIGLSYKYLIRGLGEWGWMGVSGILRPPGYFSLQGPGGDIGVPCVSGQRRREVLRLHQGLWIPGRLDGAGTSMYFHTGDSQATELNGNQLPQPLLHPPCPAECVHFNSNDSQMCLWFPTFLFSPNRLACQGSVLAIRMSTLCQELDRVQMRQASSQLNPFSRIKLPSSTPHTFFLIDASKDKDSILFVLDKRTTFHPRYDFGYQLLSASLEISFYDVPSMQEGRNCIDCIWSDSSHSSRDMADKMSKVLVL